ncbi:MAG TPA: fused MFS/spermidine synthase [Thermoanaerobaculia bacterium]|nr:fused MFS/spermidine synthase [Thermoanaerobaculia bacterium]
MSPSSKVSLLLFGSGFCALIYQTVWLREFRLIFGASTAASAAVLAIFMGGLGAGSLLLGRRADGKANPLGFYAGLEIAIALSAAVTPLFLILVRTIYIALGGSLSLGVAGGALLRLFLSSLVLLVPTVLMGGTLPAAARAVETSHDATRRNFALLYGANTLGAVIGVLASTFFLLELLGNRQTLWAASALNLLVALAARSLSRSLTARESMQTAEVNLDPGLEPVVTVDEETHAVPVPLILGAASIAGFAFLLMELVWYRMLGPLLGGSSFTFGIILAVALLGIGLGGGLYSLFGATRRVTAAGFALTCALEALFIAIPFALGDRIALIAMLIRPIGAIGFFGYVAGWAVVTAIVVLPAAFVSGVQFPMLVALLGRGRTEVGRHIGMTYAWNTAGAIAGSLAGGFGLLPFLGAIGSWKGVVVLLAILSIVTVVFTSRGRRFGAGPIAALVISALSLALLFSTGPTAGWRHSPIGVGRARGPQQDPNDLRAFLNDARAGIEWEREGVESSVALARGNGYAFIVNGKSDGHSVRDAGTQVMAALVGAILHGAPRNALVVGLGTGSSAGWLGAIPSMQRVDVAELEPAIVEVAEVCSPVNRSALKNPKIHLSIGDAREILITTRSRYDLIFSEPSNPYRAGISSLFTREFYHAASERLNTGGLFLQWLQAYEVDAETIRTVIATLKKEFRFVEIWYTAGGDLLLIASAQPVRYDAGILSRRIGEEPYRSALHHAWGVTDLAGFLSHFIARDSLSTAFAALEPPINSDDRNHVEFGFARSLATSTRFSLAAFKKLSESRNEHRPVIRMEQSLKDALIERTALGSETAPEARDLARRDPGFVERSLARAQYTKGNLPGALAHWARQSRDPETLTDLAMLAEGLATSGNVRALPVLSELRRWQPMDADALTARWHAKQGNYAEAVVALESAFGRYRRDPWTDPGIMARTLTVLYSVAASDASGAYAKRLFTLLEAPFILESIRGDRLFGLWTLARMIDKKTISDYSRRAFLAHEPHVPWREDFLRSRAIAYRTLRHPLEKRAVKDWLDFQSQQPSEISQGLQ